MSQLSELVVAFRTTYVDQLGRFQPSNLVAIAVDPGPIPSRCDGIRCIIQRYAVDSQGSEKVSGGTYYPDLYKIELINFAAFADYQDPAIAARLSALLRRVEDDWQVQGRRYFPPTLDGYERAIAQVYLPTMTN